MKEVAFVILDKLSDSENCNYAEAQLYACNPGMEEVYNKIMRN